MRQLLIDTYAENEKKNSLTQPLEVSEEEGRSVRDMKYGKKFPTPLYQQTWVLAKRAFMQRKGEILSWERIIQIGFISVLSGLLWFRRDTTGAKVPSCCEGVRSLTYASHLLRGEHCCHFRIPLLQLHVLDHAHLVQCALLLYAALTGLSRMPPIPDNRAVPPERAVLNKERATGTYRLSAYFLGKILAETPLELVLPIMFACITYWMVRVRRAPIRLVVRSHSSLPDRSICPPTPGHLYSSSSSCAYSRCWAAASAR